MQNVQHMEKRMRDKIINRRKELEKQAKDLVDNINKGREAIRNMESSIAQIQGAIQQCDWTMSQLEPDGSKKND